MLAIGETCSNRSVQYEYIVYAVLLLVSQTNAAVQTDSIPNLGERDTCSPKQNRYSEMRDGLNRQEQSILAHRARASGLPMLGTFTYTLPSFPIRHEKGTAKGPITSLL